MKIFLPKSVHVNLILVVLAGMLPVLAVILFSGWERRTNEVDDATQMVSQLADSIAGQQEKLTHGIQQWLSSLAMLPEVREMDAAACTNLFEGFMKRNPWHGGIVLIKLDGSVIASGTPYYANANFSDMKHFKGVLQNHEFSPGDFTLGRVSNLPVIPFAIPVTDMDGSLLCVLSSSLRIVAFADFFDLSSLPEESMVGLVDSNGVRLYRFPPKEGFTPGEKIRGNVWDLIMTVDKKTTATFSASDGVERIWAVHRLRLMPNQAPYLNIFVGIPKSYAISKADAVTRGYLCWMGVSLLLSACLAWLVGNFGIHLPVKRLSAVAQRIGAGDLAARSNLAGDRGSLGKLAASIDDMATSLEQDAIERKQTAMALTRAKDEAEAASRAKSQFLANMSHELRTPLNGMLGMLQLIKTTPLDKEQDEYADMAIQSGRRLTRLLSDILDLSRVEAGRMTLQSEPVSLTDLFNAMEKMFLPVVRQNGVELRYHIDPRIPGSLLGDSTRLQQVLTNLVGNAFKFTESGHVLVEAYPLPPLQQEQSRILFAVADTGPGIPDDKLDMIFSPFMQASQGFKRTHQGAGLGLSICKQLITLMGGNISVDSEVGVGTTVYFCITFNLPEKDETRHHTTGEARAQMRPGLRVLLAEDDTVSRLAAIRQLEKAGCRVTTVEDGRQAVNSLRQWKFDVVFMDIQMPVMDGVEATKAIRNGEAGPDNTGVPIIALTAYAMLGDRDEFLDAGMDGYIAKPVDMDELEQVLNEAIPNRRTP